jgi:hypothetical protein
VIRAAATLPPAHPPRTLADARRRRWSGAAFAFLGLFGAFGCRPKAPAADFASPHATILTIAGETRRFASQDLYRQPFPVDLSGINAFAAALARLENFERLHPGEQRDVVALLRGEALLCLRDYPAAAAAFARAASATPEPALRDRALARRSLAEELAAKSLYPSTEEERSVRGALEALDRRRAELRRYAATLKERPARPLAEIEAEQADVDWARAATQARSLRPDGADAALEAWAEVLRLHPESARRWRHRMALGLLLEELATEYLEANPSETLRFERAEFERLANAARTLYLDVSGADGFPEKLAARARLEAMNVLVEETLRHLP